MAGSTRITGEDTLLAFILEKSAERNKLRAMAGANLRKLSRRPYKLVRRKSRVGLEPRPSGLLDTFAFAWNTQHRLSGFGFQGGENAPSGTKDSRNGAKVVVRTVYG